MFTITYFKGNQHNVDNGKVFKFEIFKDLADQYRSPQQGGKHEGYFVRGELSPILRRDMNLPKSNILVIDGDATLKDASSCVPPIEVHEALKLINIEHFIYTTHSHKKGVNKFRAVIPCLIAHKAEMKPTAMKVIDTLNKLGVEIAYVKEMGTWTQPWFVPTRDDPEDGMFEYYYAPGEWFQAVKIDKDTGNHSDIADTNFAHVPKSNEDAIREIIAGKDFHGNLLCLSYQMRSDGIPDAMIILSLQGFMSMCPEKDGRWQSRYDDIERIVKGAPDQAGEFNLVLPEADDHMSVADLPWPPGLLGKLADDAYDQQFYQYKELAMISAIGVVAGVAGRKFNVSSTGLNVEITVVMDTGSGKDSLGSFISRTINSANTSGNASSFDGPSRFTGPKSIRNAISSARSMVCLFTEAGLLKSSKSGDQAGIKRVLLGYYSKSGKNEWTKAEKYSDDGDSIPSMRAVAITIIAESTELNLMKVLKEDNSLESGELPRQSVYRISRDVPYENTNKKSVCSPPVLARLKTLVNACAQVQASEDPQSWDLDYDEEIEEDVKEHSRFWVDMRNGKKEVSGEEPTRIHKVMASRQHLKALKYAAIATVFNHERLLTIGKTEWEWAKSMVMYEFMGISTFFKSEINSEMETLSHIVGQRIIKICTNKYKSAKLQINIKYRNAGLIPMYTLKQALRGEQQLDAINDDPKFKSSPMSGVDKAIMYMEKQGYIEVLSKDPLGSKMKSVIKLKDMFNTFMGESV